MPTQWEISDTIKLFLQKVVFIINMDSACPRIVINV